MSFQSYPASQVGQNDFVSSGVYGNQQPIINGNHGTLEQQYFPEQQENVPPYANLEWNQNQQAGVHYAHNGNHCHQFGAVSNAPLGRPEWNGNYRNQHSGVVHLIPMDAAMNSGFAVHRNLPNGQSLEVPIQQNPRLPCASVNVPPIRSTQRGKKAQFGDLAYINEYEAHRMNPFTLNRNSTTQTINSPTLFDIGLMDQRNWMKFHEQTNEMMLVNQGRNIFPQIGFTFNRMDPIAEYILGIKLELRSPNKFEYENGIWKEGDSVASADSNELFSVPTYGAELMKHGFEFKDLKIFNIGDERKKGKNSKMGMQEDQLAAARQEDSERARRMLLVVLRCKYRPLLTVYQVDQMGQMHSVRTASFEETTFIVCTQYKSKIIRDMKSMNNKFVRADAKKKCDQPLRSTCQTVSSFNHQPQTIPIVNLHVPVAQSIMNYSPPNNLTCHSTAPPPIVPSPPLCSPMNAPSTSSGNSPHNSLNPSPPLHSNSPMNQSAVWNQCALFTSSSHSPPNFADSLNASPPDTSVVWNQCAPPTSSSNIHPDSIGSRNPPLCDNSPLDANPIEVNNYQVNVGNHVNGGELEDDGKYDDVSYWLTPTNE